MNPSAPSSSDKAEIDRLNEEVTMRDRCFASLAKCAGVKESELACWIINKAVPSIDDKAGEVERLRDALKEIADSNSAEEERHLRLHDTRDKQEAFFEKYRESDPENYRLFREAREVHHEELLRIRRHRSKITNAALDQKVLPSETNGSKE